MTKVQSKIAVTASDIMSREAVTLASGSSVTTAAKLMLEHGISSCRFSMTRGMSLVSVSDYDLLAYPPPTALVPGGCSYLMTRRSA